MAGCSTGNDISQRKIIIDDAHILTGHNELMASYREYNEQLLKDYQLDFRVITTESDQDINAFANNAFRMFEQENETKTGRALLLVINTRQDLARLEVSMALEPVYTDAFTFFIEHRHMVHFFRDNRIAEGIFATTERMYTRAREAAAGEEFMADMPSQSLGGGAKVTADIGRKELNIQSKQNISVSSADTPEDVLQKYIQSRRDHNNNPDLNIFTTATIAFFRDWTVTPVQMANEVRFFTQCYDPQTLFSDDQDFAIILYPIQQRKCSPYFFKKEAGYWKLDFASMNKIIRFNHEMKWHLILEWHENMGKQKYAKLTQKDLLPSGVKTLLAPYLFAFADYTYDTNGYPYDYWQGSVFHISFNEYSNNGSYEGTFINDLHSRGAGIKSGLRKWDQIIEVAGKPITKGDLDFISQSMRETKSGENLTIRITRKNNDTVITKEIVLVAP
jgi:uncharacterized protein